VLQWLLCETYEPEKFQLSSTLNPNLDSNTMAGVHFHSFVLGIFCFFVITFAIPGRVVNSQLVVVLKESGKSED